VIKLELFSTFDAELFGDVCVLIWLFAVKESTSATWEDSLICPVSEPKLAVETNAIWLVDWADWLKGWAFGAVDTTKEAFWKEKVKEALYVNWNAVFWPVNWLLDPLDTKFIAEAIWVRPDSDEADPADGPKGLPTAELVGTMTGSSIPNFQKSSKHQKI
jgi:hypothetical protein